MNRPATAAGLLVSVLLLSAPALRAEDTVRYNDHKAPKPIQVDGTLQDENAGGVKIKVGKDVKSIPADDIVHVSYMLPKELPSQLEFDTPWGVELGAFEAKATPDEKKAALGKALTLYQALEKRLTGPAAAKAKRYVQYRIALNAVYQAKEGLVKPEAAIQALNDYKVGNSAGWELVPATRTLARLLEDKGDLKGAQDAYEELSANPDLPKDVHLDVNLAAARLLMHNNLYADAEKKLQAVKAELGKDDPQLGYVVVSLASAQVAQGRLEQVEEQVKPFVLSGDDGLKAMAHNTLGEYYEKSNQGDEAFWHYLKVDVLYAKSSEEHAKALYHLWKLFDKVKNDPARAQECYDRLSKPEYSGTEYQAKALKEKEPEKKTP
jgi:hypothetical protein